MWRTCGEPDEIGLTPMGVKLNGSGRVPPEEPPLEGALFVYCPDGQHFMAQFPGQSPPCAACEHSVARTSMHTP